MTSTYKFTLDLHEMVSPIAVRVKEGESSRALEITLCEDGKPVEINGRTNSAALAVSVGTNGYYTDCEITGNKIKCGLTNNGITNVIGRHPAEIKIFKTVDNEVTELLYTATFFIEVYPKVDSAGFANVGESTFDALTELLGQTTAFLNNELITDISYDATGDVMTISLVDGHGTAADPIVISGLKGAQGDKGDKGDKGDTGATGNGIASIVKTDTDGAVDTYTITMTSGATYTFTVTNGTNGRGINAVSVVSVVGLTRTLTIYYTDGTSSSFQINDGVGIASIDKTATVGNVDTYTITMDDGSTHNFTVTNGVDGRDVETYSLEWISGLPDNPTSRSVWESLSEEDKTAILANCATLDTIYSLPRGTYHLYIKVGTRWLTAVNILPSSQGVMAFDLYGGDIIIIYQIRGVTGTLKEWGAPSRYDQGSATVEGGGGGGSVEYQAGTGIRIYNGTISVTPETYDDYGAAAAVASQIGALIPAAASSSNQLVDKAYLDDLVGDIATLIDSI